MVNGKSSLQCELHASTGNFANPAEKRPSALGILVQSHLCIATTPCHIKTSNSGQFSGLLQVSKGYARSCRSRGMWFDRPHHGKQNRANNRCSCYPYRSHTQYIVTLAPALLYTKRCSTSALHQGKKDRNSVAASSNQSRSLGRHPAAEGLKYSQTDADETLHEEWKMK